MKPATYIRIIIVFTAYYFLFAANYLLAQKFTIPVFPDTQVEVNEPGNKVKLGMFYSQLNWIVQKKDSLNIPIVLHVGDLVDFDNYTQWETVSKGFRVLDSADVAYAVALGNHDSEAVGENTGKAAPGIVNRNLRKTSKFNPYFPVGRFKLQKGRYEERKSDNAFYIFKAGGLNWMVITLEFCARQGVVDWANETVDKYPGYNIIMLTHYHLNPDGDISDNNAGYGDLSPEEIYNQFIKKHPNMLLVLCGHTGNSTWRNDKGDNGNRIYQILQDYQNDNFGGGYLRLLEIDPVNKSISARIYSPYFNKVKPETQIRFSNVKFIKPL
jgi:hypothetical protein